MEQKVEDNVQPKKETLNTVTVKKGKFDLVFDADKISDKEKFQKQQDEHVTNAYPKEYYHNAQYYDDYPDEYESKEESVPKKEKTKEEKAHGFKTAMQGLNVSLFAGVFLFVVGGMVFLERPTMSESENRNLATFPEFSVESLMDGSYTSGISEWFNDTVPYRDVFKDITAKFRSMLGVDYGGMVVVNIDGNGVGNMDNSATTTTEATTPMTTVTEPVLGDSTQEYETTVTTTEEVTTEPLIETEEESSNDDDGMGELSNNIMIYQKRAIPIYYGNFDRGVEYARYVNHYKSDLGNDVNVYSMVCPTAISFYWPENSDVSHGSEEDNIANIDENLVNVTPIDLIPVLSQHTSEHIYSRTDHHWQPLGAYYSAQEFCSVAGVPFADLSTYTKHTIENYVGTLYGYSGSIVIKENPEDFVYYEPNNEYTTEYFDIDNNPLGEGKLLVEATGSSAYLTFMGGDSKITHVSTDVGNGRTLVIIKDSYGNALVPFLTSSFEDIYVIDMRYFNLNVIDYIKGVNATDVLFAMNTFSATGSNYQELERLRTQTTESTED